MENNTSGIKRNNDLEKKAETISGITPTCDFADFFLTEK